MSIVIALGVNTHETSYSDMAAGSEYVLHWVGSGGCTCHTKVLYFYITLITPHGTLTGVLLFFNFFKFLLLWRLYFVCFYYAKKLSCKRSKCEICQHGTLLHPSSAVWTHVHQSHCCLCVPEFACNLGCIQCTGGRPPVCFSAPYSFLLVC